MTPPPLTETLRETLDHFDEVGVPLTTTEVADRLDLGRRSTYERLDRLEAAGEISTKKVGANARVWYRPLVTAMGDRDSAVARATVIEAVAREVLGGGAAGVIVFDDDEVIWHDETLPRHFGLGDADLSGEDARAVVSETLSRVLEDPTGFVDAVLSNEDGGATSARPAWHVLPGDDRDERWLAPHVTRVGSGGLEGCTVVVFSDVTESKGTVSEAERAEILSLFGDVEEYAIFLLDARGRIQSWNTGAERIKGYAADEVLGEHVSAFYSETDRTDGVPERNLETARREGSVEAEGWRVRADGSRFWARVTLTARRDEAGDLVGYVKVTRDLTDRRERERELREEKALVESVFESQRDVVYVFDVEGNLLRWNERLCTVTGYSDAEISSLHPLTLVTPDERERVSRAMKRVLRGSTATVEAPLVTADGEEIPYEFSGAPLTDESGVAVGITGIGRDVSERKANERRLERQREELERELDEVFSRIDDAFFALDEEWRFTFVNQRASGYLERSRSELIGKTVWEAFSPARDSSFRDRCERAMETGESVSFEEYYPPHDTWYEVTAYPSPSGLSVYFRDISRRKERERDLEQYETIVETVEDGIYAVDADARFVLVNQGFCDLTGYDRDELLGEPAATVHDEHITPRAEALAAEIVSGERERATIELDVSTKSGEEVPCESRLAPFSIGGGIGRCGVVRDVTERLEQERTLRRRIHQQEVVTDLGHRALEARDLDGLMREAAELVSETLDVDLCKVLELDAAGETLLLRQGVGWRDGVVGSARIAAKDDESQAAYTLRTDQPVVVSDLDSESRFSGPDLLTSHGVRSGISTIIGPRSDLWGILGAHDPARKEFSEQDVNFVQTVATILASAIVRHEDEQDRLRQREQLAALNDLNGVVHEITEAVIERSTRAEIERTVCEHLAEAEAYRFAWIGELDVASMTARLRTEAGVDGYLDDTVISVDSDGGRDTEPAGLALQTGEMHTRQAVSTDLQSDPWRDVAEEYGFRSTAAIPIVHDGTTYGVLNVYSDRPNGFEGQERTVTEQLGEIVGHAIAATERKQALMSDEVVVLEFEIRDIFDPFGGSDVLSDRIELEHAICIEGDDYLVYGRTSNDGVHGVHALVERLPYWESVSFYEGPNDRRFELRVTEPPVQSVIASVGASVQRVTIEDGDCLVTVHASPSADVRRLRDSVEATYPDAQLLRRRQVPRNEDAWVHLRPVLSEALTDRQRTVLEVAFHAGFFAWPRDASGEEIAAKLGISSPTFHQHLRKAQRKVLEHALSTSG